MKNEENQKTLKSSREILDEEIDQAEMELKRPISCLFVSGLMAGFGIGFSILAMNIALALAGSDLTDPLTSLLIANAHSLGFTIVVMGRTDLFTEYTTLAILPVLRKRSRLKELLRFWVWIFLSNIIGAVLFTLLVNFIAPKLGLVEMEKISLHSIRLVQHKWWVIFISAALTGWIMGLLSWLVTSSRGTLGQIFFIWSIVLIVALGHLHHSISGFTMVFQAWLVDVLQIKDIAYFLVFTTIGNLFGGIIFAILTNFRTSMRKI